MTVLLEQHNQTPFPLESFEICFEININYHKWLNKSFIWNFITKFNKILWEKYYIRYNLSELINIAYIIIRNHIDLSFILIEHSFVLNWQQIMNMNF